MSQEISGNDVEAPSRFIPSPSLANCNLQKKDLLFFLQKMSDDVAVVTFQKDETVFLPLWIAWHSFLFGFRALTVIDHNSTDTRTIDVLKNASSSGVRIVHTYVHFTQKHEVLTRVLNSFNTTLIIPLDADELLVACQGDLEYADDQKWRVDQSLRRAVDMENEKFKLASRPSCGHGMPQRTMCDTSAMLWNSRSKTFYRRSTFVSTDQGNHYGSSLHNKVAYAFSHICILHQQKSPTQLWKLSLRNALTYGYFVCDAQGILRQTRQCQKLPGTHYCTYLSHNIRHHPEAANACGASFNASSDASPDDSPDAYSDVYSSILLLLAFVFLAVVFLAFTQILKKVSHCDSHLRCDSARGRRYCSHLSR